MTHIGKLADRILFLKGDVDMQTVHAVDKIRQVPDMLKMARRMEQEGVHEYNLWARECTANNDAISRQLLEALAADEEKHYDQFDKEVDSIEKFGDNYLALQSIERNRQ
jgi:bacterioferritin